MPAPFESYLTEHAARFEDELCQWLRIPSVSAISAHRNDTRRAAAWVAGQLQALGLQVEQVETPGHPIIYAEWLGALGAPTVLVYGHYDVQPADPLDEWITPPFEPARREGNIYARGATDDKGQVLTHVKAAEAWLRTAGKLPVNLKFLIEGEEEVGSENLEPFVAANRDKLACDVIVISDTAQYAPGKPAITYGLRGIAYFEVKLRGPAKDLHSGIFGGAVSNPANALAKMLGGLVDEQGRIQVPGFYDHVVPLTPREREQFAALNYDDAELCKQLEVGGLSGEAGYSTLERRWARPTCDINGLTSGYQGEGAKTVLPCRASAKLSFRLVPNQTPAEVERGLRTFLQSRLPPGVTMEIVAHHGAPGILTPLESPYMAAAEQAIAAGFGTPPVLVREGGSIPIVSTFKELLGVDTLLLGWGLNDDGAHGPNEKFCLADYHRAIKSSAWLWEHIGRLKGAKK
ncbi:MAG: dipeptidase [Planctomycetes bacterium]|nr:dipeptidase [Planctomycetota bacterium]